MVDKNDNVLKIFKNQVAYSTKMGKSLYYSVTDESQETVCTYCNQKYIVVDTKYEPCQKIEVLPLCESTSQTLQLRSTVSTCWLVEPFISMAQVGDVINLTAFYYMCPQQQVVNLRCVSPLVGSFVAFNILKINPFNQMVGRDSTLAELFFSSDKVMSTKTLDTSTMASTGCNNSAGLTLHNLKLHDKSI